MRLKLKEKPRPCVSKALFWRTIQLFKERLSKIFNKSVLQSSWCHAFIIVKQKTPVFLARIGGRKKKQFMENLEWLLHYSFLFSGDFWFLFVDYFCNFLGPVVQKSIRQWVSPILMRWMVIYPLENAIIISSIWTTGTWSWHVHYWFFLSCRNETLKRAGYCS